MQTAQTTHPEPQNEPTAPATEPTPPSAACGEMYPPGRATPPDDPQPAISTTDVGQPDLPLAPSDSTRGGGTLPLESPPAPNEPTETQNEPTPQPTAKPPISPAKLKANRQNAKKSTGPRTPAGKRRSRMNALKHGLLAWDAILWHDKNEQPTEMADLLNDLRDAIEPSDRYEELLVERIACPHWRLRRLYRYELDAVAESRMRSNLPWAQVSRGLIGITQDPAPAQLPGADHFDRILRYEAVIQRELRHLDLEVLRLKQLRLKERELRLKELEHSIDPDASYMSPDNVPSVSPSPTRPLSASPSLSHPRQTNPPTTDTPPVPYAAPDPLAKALEMVAAGFRNLRPNPPTPAPNPILRDSSERQTNPPKSEPTSDDPVAPSPTLPLTPSPSSCDPRQTNPPNPNVTRLFADPDNPALYRNAFCNYIRPLAPKDPRDEQ